MFDPDLADALADAKEALDLARLRHERAPENVQRADELEVAQARHDSARKAAVAHTVTYTFRGIGRPAYEALLMDHRPTDEQRKQWSRANPMAQPLGWNISTFPPALVAAALVEPVMSEAEVHALFSNPDWNDGELSALFFGALEAQQHRRVIDLKQ